MIGDPLALGRFGGWTISRLVLMRSPGSARQKLQVLSVKHMHVDLKRSVSVSWNLEP